MKNKIDYKSIYIYINKQKSNNSFEFGEKKNTDHFQCSPSFQLHL